MHQHANPSEATLPFMCLTKSQLLALLSDVRLCCKYRKVYLPRLEEISYKYASFRPDSTTNVVLTRRQNLVQVSGFRQQK